MTATLPLPPAAEPLEIPVSAHGFPPNLANVLGSRSLRTTWAALVHAAITVGRWHNDSFLFGRYSRYEALSRAFALYAHLARQGDGPLLIKTKLYKDLDPSEKSGVSYFLGMTMAKLWADRALGVPYLMHVDRYATQFSIALTGRRRPDLFAPLSPHQWLVVEAKGRTHGLPTKVIKDVAAQKNGIALISGRPPALAIGSVAHFESGHLELYCVDPPIEDGESLELGSNEFLLAYYEPFQAILADGGEEISDHPLLPPVRLTYLREMDLWIGLEVEMLERVQAHERSLDQLLPWSWDELPHAARLSESPQDRSPLNSVEVGGDGIVVVLGDAWADDADQRPPAGEVAE